MAAVRLHRPPWATRFPISNGENRAFGGDCPCRAAAGLAAPCRSHKPRPLRRTVPSRSKVAAILSRKGAGPPSAQRLAPRLVSRRGTSAASGRSTFEPFFDCRPCGLDEVGSALATRSALGRVHRPRLNALFLMAGPFVMEARGVISHGAVVAREHGIGAVVGIADAPVRLSRGIATRWLRGSGRGATSVHS